MRDALLAACRFHWTTISPAVFGAMFQLVKSKEARRGDGEHYTSETNILKVIEPLFLDELRKEMERLINNKSTTHKELQEFRDSLADLIFSQVASIGGLIVDEVTYVARVEGRPLDLTYKEFELLYFLVKHAGRVFSREQLLQDVWGYDYFGGTRTVDVHVRRLRAKLGHDYEKVIATVRNVGYKAVDISADGR
jgi:DNA-binding response OmpR family regulator